MIDKFFVAGLCHEVNRVFCENHGDFSNPSWYDVDDAIANSATLGVQALIDNSELTPKEMHGLWMKHKLAEGWRFGIAKDYERKLHPNLVPYEELSRAQQCKDELFSTIVKYALKNGGILHGQ